MRTDVGDDCTQACETTRGLAYFVAQDKTLLLDIFNSFYSACFYCRRREEDSKPSMCRMHFTPANTRSKVLGVALKGRVHVTDVGVRRSLGVFWPPSNAGTENSEGFTAGPVNKRRYWFLFTVEMH